MSRIVRKIITSANASKPVGPYNQAVLVDKTLYVSGQIGMNLEGALVEGGIETETKQALNNLKAIVEDAGSSMKNVIKTTILLSDISEWGKVNEIYRTYFTERHPARAAYAVKDLPKGARVEIEAIAVVGEIEEK